MRINSRVSLVVALGVLFCGVGSASAGSSPSQCNRSASSNAPAASVVTKEVKGDDGSVKYVKVSGDVIINGNNCVFGSEVFGDLTVSANNVTLVQNVVQGDFNAAGIGGACTDNHAFSDANDDGSVTTDEIGDDVSCG